MINNLLIIVVPLLIVTLPYWVHVKVDYKIKKIIDPIPILWGYGFFIYYLWSENYVHMVYEFNVYMLFVAAYTIIICLYVFVIILIAKRNRRKH